MQQVEHRVSELEGLKAFLLENQNRTDEHLTMLGMSEHFTSVLSGYRGQDSTRLSDQDRVLCEQMMELSDDLLVIAAGDLGFKREKGVSA